MVVSTCCCTNLLSMPKALAKVAIYGGGVLKAVAAQLVAATRRKEKRRLKATKEIGTFNFNLGSQIAQGSRSPVGSH